MIVDFFGISYTGYLRMFCIYSEESGHGLIHLPSRTVAFCLQFVQKLLLGPQNDSWRAAANAILHTVGGWRLNKSLFLIEPK